MQELEKIENHSDIIKMLDEYNPGHDDIQLEHFIVGSGVTDYGKYKQALAEVFSNYTGLQQLYIEKKKKEAEKNVLYAEIDELGDSRVDEAKKNLKRVEVEEKIIASTNLNRSIARAVHEITKMFHLVNKYRDLIKDQDQEELLKDYHMQRLARMINARTLWGASSGVMETVMTLPVEMQNALFQEFHKLQIVNHKNVNSYIAEASNPALCQTEPQK